ncbi:pyridoxamine 5'-phosphate oxidase-domain-containing protein [Glomus cerebriforme]|uniref:Pyridoxamine 5'-phosphate oxidase-domain-containing protein n=1 Tax=Glomus cerebriforme TaxID=658196 RepID=A0A397TK06_9GLOM|nr:pyridoxamine 5'-phosphate oxidase-domain-containing protein [Glomus cerebriforme]
MSTVPWKRVLKSVIVEHFKFSDTMQPMQLATFNAVTQRPANRSVVFRGFIKYEDSFESDLFFITTDIRSSKIDQLSSNPGFEICWWFPKTQDQFRLAGNAYVFSSDSSLNSKFPFTKLSSYFPTPNFNWDEELKSHFEKISDELRADLTRPTPGLPLEHENFTKKLAVVAKNERENELIKQSFANFALVIFEVEKVDRTELATDPHKKTNWKLNNQTGEWIEQRVYP